MNDAPVAFAPDLSAFARPIAGEFAPGGPSLRYDPVFLQARRAREADDPALPRGEWERPLKDADWVLVESLCSRLLVERSKDFQLAWWLTEAWLHRFGLAGLRAGIGVVTLLAREFWDGAHPLIDNGECDARLAPFTWADSAIAWALRVQVPLIALPDHDPPVGTLDLWERTLRGPEEPPSSGGRRKAAVPDTGPPRAGRAHMLAHGTPAELARLAAMAEQLQPLRIDLRCLVDVLAHRLGREGPPLARLADTLVALRHAVEGLLEGRDPRPAKSLSGASAEAVAALPLPADGVADAWHGLPHAVPAGAGPAPPGEAIASRDDAYRMLSRAATFLERNEPHSPAPYLVRRAIAWGGLSLAELMQEIRRDDGDFKHYFSLLGIERRTE